MASFSELEALLLLLNFCDDNLSISTFPDFIGYICSMFSPANTKPTHCWPWSFPPSELPFVCQTMPTQEHRLSIGWNTQLNGVESGLPALHAHTRYTAVVQLCLGVGFNPNLQIGTVYVEAIKMHQWRLWGCTPSNSAEGGRLPCAPLLVHVLVQGCSETP